MEKLRSFEFFTVVLPGATLLAIIIFIFNGFDHLDFDKIFVTALILLIPVYIFIGAVLSIFGAMMERWIDTVLQKVGLQSREHPVSNLLDNYRALEKEIQELCPELLGVEKRKDPNAIFEKCRIILYQKDFSARAQSIGIQATFYRNFVAVFFLVLLVLLTAFFIPDQYLNPLISLHYFFVLLTTLGLFVLSRVLSQRLYFDWFREILANLDTYFKLSKNNKL